VHDSAIFQRTEAGRAEIQTKMHGLTQSERLALIVIDGITPYIALREKLKGLADERFERALASLAKKHLIFEVLLKEENVVPDHFEPEVIDRFLQQDPMDPVTIISFDAEDDFDLDMPAEIALPIPPTPSHAPLVQDVVLDFDDDLLPLEKDIHISQAPKITSVDFYVPLEKRHPEAGGRRSSTASPAIRARMSAPVLSSSRPQWGQVFVAAGVILIVASVLLRWMR
jgi:hypothetical protein